MRKMIEKVVLLAVMTVMLLCAWFPLFDNQAAHVVDRGLERAVISFAVARGLNAGLSVLQSVDISFKPLGIGVSTTIGQLIHPINELVGRFAELMLAACIAFGAMKFLIIIGGAAPVSLILSVVALWWSWLRWDGKIQPPLLTKVLVVLVLIRFAVPVVSVGSEEVFQALLANHYKTALDGISKPGMLPSVEDWQAAPIDIAPKANEFIQSTESWVKHIVNLIALFLLETLVVPLLLFWGLCRASKAMLNHHGKSGSEY